MYIYNIECWYNSSRRDIISVFLSYYMVRSISNGVRIVIRSLTDLLFQNIKYCFNYYFYFISIILLPMS
jgi:hypothetical protein